MRRFNQGCGSGWIWSGNVTLKIKADPVQTVKKNRFKDLTQARNRIKPNRNHPKLCSFIINDRYMFINLLFRASLLIHFLGEEGKITPEWGGEDLGHICDFALGSATSLNYFYCLEYFFLLCGGSFFLLANFCSNLFVCDLDLCVFPDRI